MLYLVCLKTIINTRISRFCTAKNKHFLTEPAIAGGLTKLEVIAICFTEFSELCGKLIKNVIRDASSCLQMVLFIGNFFKT